MSNILSSKAFSVFFVVSVFLNGCGASKKLPDGKDSRVDMPQLPSSSNQIKCTDLFYNNDCWTTLDITEKSAKLWKHYNEDTEWLYDESKGLSKPFSLDMRFSDKRFFNGLSLFMCENQFHAGTYAGYFEGNCKTKLDANNEYKWKVSTGTVTVTFQAATQEIPPERRQIKTVSFVPN